MPKVQPKTAARIVRARAAAREIARRDATEPDTILREYAGKYVAWSPDGLRIVAVAASFDAAERAAARNGYPMAAVAKVPRGRTVG